jgi:two-component system sensor histidine kinase KdpD
MNRHRVDPRRLALMAVVIGGLLGAVTIAIAALESRVDVPDASSVYLLAVVGVAVAFGTTPAVLTAVGSFLLYDVLFIEPFFNFTVRDPREWLNLLLLLVVGIVVGRLAGRQRDRAETALAGEREAQALFGISFTLANRRETVDALSTIATMLRADTRMARVWMTIGKSTVAADDSAPPPPAASATPAVYTTLRRRPGDEPAEWVRVHRPSTGAKGARDPDVVTYQVLMVAGERTLGSLWASRGRDAGDPDDAETRVLAAAADQVAGSLERDRLAREATSVEITRRSDALKSALLDSVSHDLRTPLASIRAAAGTLMDADIDWPADERRTIAAGIDREADWLNRLVTNLLDMSRIEAGELRPSPGMFELADLVEQAMARSLVRAKGETRPLTVDVPVDLPPVWVDEVFVGQVLANTLDNAAKYAGPNAPIAVTARALDDAFVRVTVEDGGEGVPPDAMPRLFEKFYRVPRKSEGSRRGTGIGLSVVQGLVEAMGGRVTARKSDLGGLAVDLDLPTVRARSDS